MCVSGETSNGSARVIGDDPGGGRGLLTTHGTRVGGYLALFLDLGGGGRSFCLGK